MSGGRSETPFVLKIPLINDAARHLEAKGYLPVQNPHEHVILTSIRPQTELEFFNSLNERISRSEKQQSLIFIHGYNVSFEDSCRRTAQIAYDLKYKGAPILYSWPSAGNPLLYVRDKEMIDGSINDFERFLISMAEKTRSETIHLVAHSLGSRALIYAMASIAKERGVFRRPIFKEVILAAPDFDAELFKGLAKAILPEAERITIYASSNDKALRASTVISDTPRLGEAGSRLVIVPGVDTIDASVADTSFLAHSSYGSTVSVLNDIFELIDNRRADDRFHLAPRSTKGSSYWEFRLQK